MVSCCCGGQEDGERQRGTRVQLQEDRLPEDETSGSKHVEDNVKIKF